MAKNNGGGKLDRLEAILDTMGDRLEKVATMGYLHEDRRARIENNFEKMREAESHHRAEQQAREGRIDARIDRLVAAIGELIASA